MARKIVCPVDVTAASGARSRSAAPRRLRLADIAALGVSRRRVADDPAKARATEAA
jgi:hypothetical protein